ncbi:MAG TPA: DUF4136 domain-containing protein [Gemmatimonadaceae bacterium]|jgi:hypothetical protein
MRHTDSLRRSAVTYVALGALVFAAACKGRTVNVASGAIDTLALQQFQTFSIKTPTPPADSVAVATTNGTDRVGGAVMDMDPMLSTSLVGRAIRQDLANAFTSRGYQAVESTPDFYVAYYAGTGHVVDTRASQKSYRTNGQKITTQTFVYPAGTIVVDVVDARSDSLVWRGTGLARIPNNPNDYARAIQETVKSIVGTFPRAQR